MSNTSTIDAPVSPSPATLPLLLDARATAKLLSIGRTKLYTLDISGRLPSPVRLGRSVRWNAAELAAWTAAGCPSRASWEARKGGRR